MSRRILSLSGLAVAACVVAACGIPKNSELERVRADDPFGLALVTTTSTTTTSTTIVPTTLPVATTSTAPLPETTAPVISEQAKLYFVNDDRLFLLEVAVVANATPSIIIDKLLEGVPQVAEVTEALQTQVPPGAVRDITFEGGVAYLDVSAAFVAQVATLTPNEQALAFGQLVLTVLQGDPIGQIIFSSEGAPVQVVKGNGETSQPSETLSVDDYANLLTG